MYMAFLYRWKKLFFLIISISHEPTYNSWPEVMTLVEQFYILVFFSNILFHFRKFIPGDVYITIMFTLCVFFKHHQAQWKQVTTQQN